MANVAECRSTLRRYVKARIPFVSVRSAERSRVLEILQDIAKETQTPFVVHTLSQGLRELVSDRSVSEERSLVGALDAAGQGFLTRQNLTFVFTDVQDLAGDTAISRQLYDASTIAERRAGSIIVITTEPVWSPLQRLGMSITLDPPSEDEMWTILHEQIEPYRSQIEVQWDEDDYRHAASILAGITKIEAENVVATLLAEGAVLKSDIAELSRAKDRIFSDIAGIERVPLEQRKDLRVGGLEGLRMWLDRERQFLTADLRKRQMRPPRGVLLVGVPGCGKSLSAKFVACSWDLPLYRLDMASIFGQYVGQSESRFKEALGSADHVAPCVLWIDEIEKGLAGAATESTGITNRLIGQFLFWLQESSARVFIVATANDVTRLPAELLRRGRFDEIFFVDLPSAEERADIITIYLQRYLQRDDEELVQELAKCSEGFTGADIESAVREMGKEAERSGDDAVGADFARSCFENVVPLSQTNPEQVEMIREWGRARAVPASSMPVTVGPAVNARRVVIP